MKTIKDALKKLGLNKEEAIKFETLLIKHVAKKMRISEEEAARHVAEHWAKNLRKHIEDAIGTAKKENNRFSK